MPDNNQSTGEGVDLLEHSRYMECNWGRPGYIILDNLSGDIWQDLSHDRNSYCLVWKFVRKSNIDIKVNQYMTDLSIYTNYKKTYEEKKVETL